MSSIGNKLVNLSGLQYYNNNAVAPLQSSMITVATALSNLIDRVDNVEDAKIDSVTGSQGQVLGFIDDNNTIGAIAQAEKGDKGDNGASTTISEISYQEGTSGTVTPTGTWLSSIPSVANGDYLWTRFTIVNTSSNGTQTTNYAYTVTRQGEDIVGDLVLPINPSTTPTTNGAIWFTT